MPFVTKTFVKVFEYVSWNEGSLYRMNVWACHWNSYSHTTVHHSGDTFSMIMELNSQEVSFVSEGLKLVCVTFSQQSSNIHTLTKFQPQTVPAFLLSTCHFFSLVGLPFRDIHPLVSDGAPGRGLGPLIGSHSWCRLLQADHQRSVDAVQVSRCSTSTLSLFSPPGLSQFLLTPPSACPPLCALIYAQVEIWSGVKQANRFPLNCRKHLKRSPRQVNESFRQDCMNLAHVIFCYVRHCEVVLLATFLCCWPARLNTWIHR